jgi:putative RNA 2'-phosphotransferase
VAVDLDLPPRLPPERLYHGTATRFLDSIRGQGLHAGARRHVHLSADHATAVRVGRRHGRPVVLGVRALDMHTAGHAFFLSANGVWLTVAVPVLYLDFPAGA